MLRQMWRLRNIEPKVRRTSAIALAALMVMQLSVLPAMAGEARIYAAAAPSDNASSSTPSDNASSSTPSDSASSSAPSDNASSSTPSDNASSSAPSDNASSSTPVDGAAAIDPALGATELELACSLLGIECVGTEITGLFPGAAAPEDLTIPEGVQTIADGVFKGQNTLLTLSLPASLTSVGEQAFSDCRKLTKVAFKSGRDADGKGLCSIGPLAFASCHSLVQLDLTGVGTIGGQAFYDARELTRIELRDVYVLENNAFAGANKATVLSLAKNDVFTSIGAGAFTDCKSIVELLIPSNIQSIGQGAFSGCSGVKRIEYEGKADIAASTFADCVNVEFLRITNQVSGPSGGLTVGPGSFKNKKALKAVDMTHGVEEVQAEAFAGCTALETFYPPIDNEIVLGQAAFKGCTELKIVGGGFVNNVMSSAFEGCEKLSAMSFSSMKSIGDSAFKNCKSLSQIDDLSSINSIGASAFEGCAALERVDLSSSAIKAIEPQSFLGCTSLETLALPSTLESIGFAAFEGCEKMTISAFPPALTKLGGQAFKDCKKLAHATLPTVADYTQVEARTFYGCIGLAAVDIPANVQVIGEEAFRNCSSLAAVYGMAGAERIERFAFGGCAALGLTTLPASVKTVGDYAFCVSGITDFTMPQTVTSWGSFVFLSCDQLTDIKLPENMRIVPPGLLKHCTAIGRVTLPRSVTRLREDVFEGCTSLKSLTLPHTALGATSTTYSGVKLETLEVTLPEQASIQEQKDSWDAVIFDMRRGGASFSSLTDAALLIGDSATGSSITLSPKWHISVSYITQFSSLSGEATVEECSRLCDDTAPIKANLLGIVQSGETLEYSGFIEFYSDAGSGLPVEHTEILDTVVDNFFAAVGSNISTLRQRVYSSVSTVDKP